MSLPRVFDDIEAYLKSGKILVIYGARQVGKTTLLSNYLKTTPLKYRFDNGDDINIQHHLNTPDLVKLKEYAEDYDLIVIDEAQRIENIGQSLKLLIDYLPKLQIIVTDSSSFELAGQIGEPLTGRKKTLTLYPLSQLELRGQYNQYDLKEKLEQFMIYGAYPEALSAKTTTSRQVAVMEIMQSYLLKDILELDKIKNSKILLDLLRLLAFQIGNEVSFSELARTLGIDHKTIARYIDLLEKAFVVYNLRGYSRNLRKEINKKSKYYFYDVGIRNAIVSNFNSLELRNDVGVLFENFVVMERIKKQAYTPIYANNFFWRTWDGQEIDFIEEREGKLLGYEIKWKPQTVKPPKDWLPTYDNASFEVIHSDNYLDFVLRDG